MSKIAIWSGICLLAMTMSYAAAETFEGEISDSQCAFNVHSLTRSHQEMLKTKSHGTTSADCTRYCVRHLGGRFALSVNKDAYRLSGDNEMIEPFAAQKVKLYGTLDKKTNTIQVQRIEAVQ